MVVMVTHVSNSLKNLRTEAAALKWSSKYLAIFTGKHLYWSPFLIIKGQQCRCFPVNIAKFLRTVFYRIPPMAFILNLFNHLGNYRDVILF